MRGLRLPIVGLAVCAVLIGWQDPARAGTIIVLAGGPAAIGIQYNGATLSTAGPQNTAVEFTGFIDQYPDIATPPASITFGGITPSGSTLVSGTSILQQFTGGSLSLYDSTHTLLLSANLSSSALTGTIGRVDGGLFTTFFSNVTGGTLAAIIDGPTLVFQMHLSNINGGSGFSGGNLQPFTASVNANMDAGQVVPEPATNVLLAIFAALTLALTLLRGCHRLSAARAL